MKTHRIYRIHKENTLTFKQIGETYRIYDGDQDMGNVYLGSDYLWHLTISCMDYKIKGRYRNDLFNKANRDYEIHMGIHKGE